MWLEQVNIKKSEIPSACITWSTFEPLLCFSPLVSLTSIASWTSIVSIENHCSVLEILWQLLNNNSVDHFTVIISRSVHFIIELINTLKAKHNWRRRRKNMPESFMIFCKILPWSCWNLLVMHAWKIIIVKCGRKFTKIYYLNSLKLKLCCSCTYYS